MCSGALVHVPWSLEHGSNLGDELEPVQEILSLVRVARSLAVRILADFEEEYQDLRNTYWPEDSDAARRFYWLRWQRDALQNFANQQAEVTEDLWTETNNVWQASELIDADNADTTPAADTTAEADTTEEEVQITVAQISPAAA